NYGATHLIVGRDHAGPGKRRDGTPFYGPYEAQEVLARYADEIGITMMPFQMLVYVAERDDYFPDDKVPAGMHALNISGTEQRDLNIQRIGYVAAEITKAGGIAICAPIAPYDGTRKRVRSMIETNGGFVLVHVATSIDVCEQRDRKGLYAKARAGLVKEFTG